MLCKFVKQTDPPANERGDLYRCEVCGIGIRTLTVPEQLTCHERTPRAEPPQYVPSQPPIPDNLSNRLTDEEKQEAERVLGYTANDIWHWKSAIWKWIKANKPVRTAEQITEIVKTCEVCKKFDAKSKRCSICRCHINNSQWSIYNKAKMGSEQCDDPEGAKWLPIVAVKSDIPIVVSQPIAAAPIPEPKLALKQPQERPIQPLTIDPLQRFTRSVILGAGSKVKSAPVPDKKLSVKRDLRGRAIQGDNILDSSKLKTTEL